MDRTHQMDGTIRLAGGMMRGTAQWIMANAYLADHEIKSVRMLEVDDIRTLVLLIELLPAGRRHPFDVDLVLARAREAAYAETPCGFDVVAVLDVGEEILRACTRCGAPIGDDTGAVPNRGTCAPCAELDYGRDLLAEAVMDLELDLQPRGT